MSNTTLATGLEDEELRKLAVDELAKCLASRSFDELIREWQEICEQRKFPYAVNFDARWSKDDRPVFIFSCNNGYHESLEGYEHALELLVDSHRVKWEDLESTHTALMQVLGVSLKEARRICSREPERAREVLGR